MIECGVSYSGPVFTPEAGRVAEDALGEALEKSAEVIAQQVRERAEVVTGRLRAGVQVSGSGLEVTVDTGGVEHAQPVELGRARAFAPIQPLERWVAVKLGLSGAEATAAAYRISTAQSRRGVRPKPFFGPGIEAADQEVSKILEEVPGRVVEALES